MIDPGRLQELTAMDGAELSAYLKGYDQAMDLNWETLERLEQLQRHYWWLVVGWFLLGAMTGYLIGANFG